MRLGLVLPFALVIQHHELIKRPFDNSTLRVPNLEMGRQGERAHLEYGARGIHIRRITMLFRVGLCRQMSRIRPDDRT